MRWCALLLVIAACGGATRPTATPPPPAEPPVWAPAYPSQEPPESGELRPDFCIHGAPWNGDFCEPAPAGSPPNPIWHATHGDACDVFDSHDRDDATHPDADACSARCSELFHAVFCQCAVGAC